MMKADLSGQVRELMEHGLRPVTMTDIKSRVPSRASGFSRVASLGDRPERARRVMVAAAAGMACLATIATIFGITALAGPSRPAVDPAAVAFLRKAADAAARQPVPHVRDGQYMYVETREAVPANPAEWGGKAVVPIGQKDKSKPFPRHIHLKLTTSRTWLPVGRLCSPGPYRPGARCPSLGGLNDATYRLLQTLPTNPHSLLALIYRVERGHGPGPDQEAFVTIGDLLRARIAPPKVTAAIYRAAALIPGVTLDLGATDAIGRGGVGVTRVGPGADGGVRDELIFSSTTFQLLGERTVIARTGTTTSASAIIARAFVDHRGQVP
jgi:hypothetical protein